MVLMGFGVDVVETTIDATIIHLSTISEGGARWVDVGMEGVDEWRGVGGVDVRMD